MFVLPRMLRWIDLESWVYFPKSNKAMDLYLVGSKSREEQIRLRTGVGVGDTSKYQSFMHRWEEFT